MTNNKRTIAARMADCDVVYRLTVEEAKALPGFLKRIVPAALSVNGYYTCTLDGMKALFILKEN